jgi:dolichol kinase
MTGTTLWERSQTRLSQGDLGRRLVHVAGTAFPALYVLPFVEWWLVGGIMLGATTIASLIELGRLRFGLDLFLFDYLRGYEEDSLGAYLLFMLSATAVALVFEPRIAIPSILMLTLADPVAGAASVDELRRMKRPRALVTMFLACALLTVPFLHEKPLAIVLGGLGGMLADGIKPIVRGVIIDDDLTIAPAGAIGIWVGLELGTIPL